MIIIKIQHENDIHTLPVAVLPSVESLKHISQAMYGLGASFVLKFMDDNGELIVVEEYENLLRALSYANVDGDVETIVLYAVEEDVVEEVEPGFDPEVIVQTVEDKLEKIGALIEAYLKEKEVNVKFEAFVDSCEKNFNALSESAKSHYENVKTNFVSKHAFSVEEHLAKLRAEVAVLGELLSEHMHKIPELTGRLAPLIVDHTNRAMELLKDHTDSLGTAAATVTSSIVEQLNSVSESAQPVADATQVVVSDIATVIRQKVEPAINRLYLVASNEIERAMEEKEEAEAEEKVEVEEDDGITDLLILEQMGFNDREKNEMLLAANDNDLGEVVAILVGDM